MLSAKLSGRLSEKQVSDFGLLLSKMLLIFFGSLRTQLLILRGISYNPSTRPFGKRDELTEASGDVTTYSVWIHIRQNGVVAVCQARYQS